MSLEIMTESNGNKPKWEQVSVSILLILVVSLHCLFCKFVFPHTMIQNKIKVTIFDDNHLLRISLSEIINDLSTAQL